MRILIGLIWGLLLALAAWGLAAGTTLLTPQELAFVLGLAGFMLLGARLVWGYGALAAFAEAALAGKEPDRERAEAEARVPEPERLGLAALAGLWYAALDPYRYAFYAVYATLFLITLTSKLVLPLPDAWAWITGSLLLEGVFWGASVAVLLVWALSRLAVALVGELAARGASAGA